MRCRFSSVLPGLMVFASLLSLPAGAQPAGTSRSIPTFMRPGGFPDPARRVEYGRSTQMMVRTAAGTYEPLYRLEGGSYVPAIASGYRTTTSACPSSYTSPLSRGGDPRTRMIDLAAAEWAYFGLPVLDMAVEPSAVVPRVLQPDGVVDIVEPRRNASIGNRVLRQAPRLGLMEDDEAVEGTIAGYWAATGGDEAMRVQSIVNYGWPGAGWAMPWSAAFISWLACEAGLSTSQFRRSASHYDYVRAAVRARDGTDPDHIYVAYDLIESTPEPGDLLCTSRGDSTFSSIADVRYGNSDSFSLHCDLVVKTDVDRRRLFAIGGNVNQSVTLSVIATDAKGRPLTDRDIVGAHRWFALLKYRGGNAKHDLDDTPTVQALYRDYARYSTRTRSPPPIPLQGRTTAPAPAAPAAKDKGKGKEKGKEKAKEAKPQAPKDEKTP